MKKVLSLVLALILLAAFAACKSTVEVDENTFADGDQYEHIGGELNVLNWGEYIDEELIALFRDGEQEAMPLPCVTYGREDDPLTQSHRLFTALRELDERGAERVYARCPSAEGVGMAVYNRLLRAAGFHVIDASQPRG